jgi:tetratricopeptide (TPR) repeat protein
VWAAVPLFLVLALELALAAPRLSQTFDEADHLFAGYRYWKCGDFGLNPEHPPLAKLVAALPLLVGEVKEPGVPCGDSTTTTAEDFALGKEFLYLNDAPRLLFEARMSAAFFTLLTALLVYLGARGLGGGEAGLLGLALFVFEPTVLAHGALVTTDIAVSAFLLGAVLAWERAPGRGGFLVLAGVSSGLCLAAKHSGALVFPILVLLIPAYWGRKRLGAALLALGLVGLIAWGVLWSVYDFRFDPRPQGHAMTVSLEGYMERATGMSGTSPRGLGLVRALDRARALPESYLYGAANVLVGSASGGRTFLFGKLLPEGVWYYFPTAALVKETLGFLGLLVLGIAGLGGARGRALLIPPCFYLAFAMTSKMNIGIRHLLPIVPFLSIFLGLELERSRRKWLALSLLLAHALSSLRSFPDYLAYSNEVVGGPRATYRVLSDSNADWGQGLVAAARDLEERGIKDCALAYFGTAEPSAYGVHCRTLPGSPEVPTRPLGETLSGTVLLSAGLWAGLTSGPPPLNPYASFRERTPARVLAGSLLVYEGTFDVRLLSALTHEAQARVLADEGRISAALLEAQEASRLAPLDPFVRRSLARILRRAGRKDEAAEAFATARRLAAAQGPEFHPRLLRSLAEDEP